MTTPGVYPFTPTKYKHLLEHWIVLQLLFPCWNTRSSRADEAGQSQLPAYNKLLHGTALAQGVSTLFMLDESVLENNDVVVPVTQSALPSTVKRKAKDNVKKTSNKKAKKESRLLTDTRTAIDGIMGKYVEDESIKVKDEVADDEDEDAYN